MLPLKKRLETDLGRAIIEAQDRLNTLNMAASVLASVRLSRAKFHVQIQSCWADHGEETTDTIHHGKLEDAIHLAQEEFKRVNKRSDVQSNWQVFILLGDHKLKVPEEYWKDFTPYHA